MQPSRTNTGRRAVDADAARKASVVDWFDAGMKRIILIGAAWAVMLAAIGGAVSQVVAWERARADREKQEQRLVFLEANAKAGAEYREQTTQTLTALREGQDHLLYLTCLKTPQDSYCVGSKVRVGKSSSMTARDSGAPPKDSSAKYASRGVL